MSKLKIRQVLEMVQSGICSVNEAMDLLEQDDPYAPVKLSPEHGLSLYGYDHGTKDSTIYIYDGTQQHFINGDSALDLSKLNNTPNIIEFTQSGESIPLGMYDWTNEYPEPNEALKDLFKKCECGSESVGGSAHSAWCPKG